MHFKYTWWITFICCYIVFVNEQKRKITITFAALFLFITYLFFDYVRCQYTGTFMYGSIGVIITSEYDLIGELGYKIGSRWWGRGYTSEAARAVIDYMFNNTDIERIQSYSSVENPASKKVMEKVGMRYEGFSRHSYRTRDGFQDCTFLGIIRDEWEQTK